MKNEKEEEHRKKTKELASAKEKVRVNKERIASLEREEKTLQNQIDTKGREINTTATELTSVEQAEGQVKVILAQDELVRELSHFMNVNTLGVKNFPKMRFRNNSSKKLSNYTFNFYIDIADMTYWSLIHYIFNRTRNKKMNLSINGKNQQ